MATLVRFLLDQDDDVQHVFAFFPQLRYDSSNDMKWSYAHTGQHSACSKHYAADCMPATKEEYTPLYNELISIGYTLTVF